MKIELVAKAGETIERVVELRNTTENVTIHGQVERCYLGQTVSGNWQIIDAASVDTASPPGRSCFGWLAAAPSEIELAPLKVSEVKLRLVVPREARGSYVAALVIRNKPPGGTGISLVVQFLVPIVVHIQGVTARQDIQLVGGRLKAMPATEDLPARTLAGVEIRNAGETYAGVTGQVSVLRPAGESWRLVSTVELPTRGLLPGNTIILGAEFLRRLPAGHYRLQSSLIIGGRRAAKRDEETDFEGDPEVKNLVEAVDLHVEPALVTLDAVPRSHRNAAVTVSNPTDQTVTVRCKSIIPLALKGVAMGAVLGEHFACNTWMRAAPDRFQLAPGAQRAIRIAFDIPGFDQPKPFYFGELEFSAFSADEQLVGKATSFVRVANPKVSAEPQAQGVRVVIAGQQDTKYEVTAQFANVGQVPYTPTATAAVTAMTGEALVTGDMETQSGMVLPLGTPVFSCILDFAAAPTGTYYLVVNMNYAGKLVRQRVPIKVSIIDRNKTVAVVEETPVGETPTSGTTTPNVTP